jgi:hypothetical protein
VFDGQDGYGELLGSPCCLWFGGNEETEIFYRIFEEVGCLEYGMLTQ